MAVLFNSRRHYLLLLVGRSHLGQRLDIALRLIYFIMTAARDLQNPDALTHVG